MDKTWKEYMLNYECDVDEKVSEKTKKKILKETVYFDTQEEMLNFIENFDSRTWMYKNIRVESVFRMETLDISKELQEIQEKIRKKNEPKKIAKKIYNLEDVLPLKIIPKKTED